MDSVVWRIIISNILTESLISPRIAQGKDKIQKQAATSGPFKLSFRYV